MYAVQVIGYESRIYPTRWRSNMGPARPSNRGDATLRESRYLGGVSYALAATWSRSR